MPFDSSVSQLVRGLSGSSCCFPSLFFQALLQVWFLHQGFSQLTIYLTKPLKGDLSSWSPRCSTFLTFLGSEMNKGFHESIWQRIWDEMRCYWQLVGEHIRNLGTNLGIHWELDENTLGTRNSHATPTSPIRRKKKLGRWVHASLPHCLPRISMLGSII